MKNIWKTFRKRKKKKKWWKKNNTEKGPFFQAKIYAVPSRRDSSVRKYQVSELKKSVTNSLDLF